MQETIEYIANRISIGDQRFDDILDEVAKCEKKRARLVRKLDSKTIFDMIESDE